MAAAPVVPQVKAAPIRIMLPRPPPSRRSKLKSYNELDCSDTLLSANDIITRWGRDREELGKLTDLKQPFKDITPKDDMCVCGLATQRKIFVVQGACLGCNVLTRLFEHGDVVRDVPVAIQAGMYTGMKIRVHNYRRGLDVGYGLQGYERNEIPYHAGMRLMRDIKDLALCTTLPSTPDFWTCKGSGIEHYIIASCFLEEELYKARIPCTPTFKWVYECKGDVNTVEEVPDLGLGTLREVAQVRAPGVMRGLLLQLVSTLHYYTAYMFTHGAPSLRALGFSSTPAVYTYDDVKIAAPVTLHLLPSTTSAFTVGTNRLYHPGGVTQRPLDYKLLPPMTTSVTPAAPSSLMTAGAGASACTGERCEQGSWQHFKRIITYRIGASYDTYMTYVRSLGVPLFYASFDMYAFWAALMCEAPFRDAIMADAGILRIWQQLFTPQQYESIMTDLQSLTTPSPQDLTRILAAYDLRCDALAFVWSQLKLLREP